MIAVDGRNKKGEVSARFGTAGRFTQAAKKWRDLATLQWQRKNNPQRSSEVKWMRHRNLQRLAAQRSQWVHERLGDVEDQI